MGGRCSCRNRFLNKERLFLNDRASCPHGRCRRWATADLHVGLGSGSRGRDTGSPGLTLKACLTTRSKIRATEPALAEPIKRDRWVGRPVKVPGRASCGRVRSGGQALKRVPVDQAQSAACGVHHILGIEAGEQSA
jgi:hypothetical protein